MKQVLNKFVATEGVLGAYILHPENGVFESDMPPQFSEESLRQIGRNLAGLTDLARSDFSDPEDVSFFFESAVLRIQDVDEGYHFIALFSPDMDRDVLGKAVDAFIIKFDPASTPSPTLSLVKPLDGQDRKTVAQSAEDSAPQNLIGSGTLSGPLEIIQSALSKVVGPMAKIVFFDALEQWVRLGAPCMESLPLLTDIVTEEIGDADLANGFKEKLPSYCCSSSPDLLSIKRKQKKNDMKLVQNL